MKDFVIVIRVNRLIYVVVVGGGVCVCINEPYIRSPNLIEDIRIVYYQQKILL